MSEEKVSGGEKKIKLNWIKWNVKREKRQTKEAIRIAFDSIQVEENVFFMFKWSSTNGTTHTQVEQEWNN